MYQIPAEVLRFLKDGPPSILVAPNVPVFTILYANPAYHEATLTAPDDIVGIGFLEAFPESPEDVEGDNVDVLRNSLTECAESGRRVELPGKRYDIPIRGTDQFETRYWQASNNPVFDDKGELVYIAHVTVDITGAYDLAKKERIAREVTEAKRRDLHALLMEAPAAIAILDGPGFVYEFENAIHRSIFYDKELLGKAFRDAFPHQENNSLIESLKDVYHKRETHQQTEVSVSMCVAGSSEVEDTYWNFIYNPRYNSKAKVDGVVVFAYDVTGQVMSRKKVEESEKRLQTILETMAEGIGIVNSEGTIVYANPMAEKLLGLKKREITQRSYHDPRWGNLKLDGTPLPAEEHPIYISMATGSPVFDHEIGVSIPNEEPLFLSINAAPLRDEEGEITGAIGTFMDVTQRRKSLRMKDEFISTISHELKTPVTSVKAYWQMLNRSLAGNDNADIGRFMDRLGVQVNRLESLIKDFLDVARIDSSKLELKSVRFEIDKVIADLVFDLQLLTPTHKLIIAETQPLTVFTDQNKILQVLTNLITNAVKYSPDADKVCIYLNHVGNELICRIEDFGIGIPDSQKTLVFDRFHQAGKNTGSGLSLGLGLYISKEIIEKAGGRIWLESVPGQGSSFYFSLPIVR